MTDEPKWGEGHKWWSLDEPDGESTFCDLCEICQCHNRASALAPCPGTYDWAAESGILTAPAVPTEEPTP